MELGGDEPSPPKFRIYPPGYTCKVFSSYCCLADCSFMAHTAEEKKRLLNRVHRIMGQVASIEKALDQEAECADVLHNISACRGAMDGLMAEVIEGHIRFHILGQNGSATDEQTQAADDLVSALRAYLK
jgi:DNA-binding FrmR family transcriptional regulator